MSDESDISAETKKFQQAVFDYLSENLSLDITHTAANYESPPYVTVTLLLRNPATGKYVSVASATD